MIELDELLYRWQQGHTISQLSRSLGQSRQTVRASTCGRPRNTA
ncbi:hypothetical protein [Geoalkalibacter halelectricus]|nr:hypothetical protein [Geoalkalibacter halelectricus]